MARRRLRIPRLYAAASLKPRQLVEVIDGVDLYSAALCRGLIEAACQLDREHENERVFRGSMPRPH